LASEIEKNFLTGYQLVNIKSNLKLLRKGADTLGKSQVGHQARWPKRSQTTAQQINQNKNKNYRQRRAIDNSRIIRREKNAQIDRCLIDYR
jgi:hypothetical protein